MAVDRASVLGRESRPGGICASVAPGREADGSRRASMLVAAVPTLVAAGLCAYGISSRSLGFDESASVTIAAQHGAALSRALAHDGGNMSAYYLLLHLVTALFGNSIAAVRLPSVVFAAATAGLVTLIAQQLFTVRVALISGLLAAVSLPIVFWGQSARGYAPMVSLACASYLAFVTLVRREEEGRPTTAAAAGYAAATALAAYMSFVTVLIVPAQLLMLARRRRAIRPLAYALGCCVACWVPLVILALSRGSGQLFWVPRPTLRVERQVLDGLASAGLAPSFHHTATGVALLVLTAVVVIGVAVRAARGEAAWSRGLLLSWLLVPVVLAWLESLVGQSIFMPRNLLMAVPPVGILLALGVTDSRLPRVAGAALLATVIVLRLLQVTASYGVSPEDPRSATRYVLARSSSSDCAIFYPSDVRMAFRYYLVGAGNAWPRSILPAVPWSNGAPFVEDYFTLTPAQLASLPGRCPRLWLLSSHEGQPDGPAVSRAHRARYLRMRATLSAEYPHRVTKVFGYAATERVDLFTSG